MAKKKKFRRVIKWGKWNPKLNGKELIIWGLLMMIPGINILSDAIAIAVLICDKAGEQSIKIKS